MIPQSNNGCKIEVWARASVLGSFLPRERTSITQGPCYPFNPAPIGPIIVP